MYEEDENGNQIIAVEDVTAADISKANTIHNARASVKGQGEDLTQIQAIERELEVYEGKSDHADAGGAPLTAAEAAKLNSLRTTLAWQKNVYNQSLALSGMERRDAINATGDYDADMKTLEDARKTNMETAVLRVQRDQGVTKFEALQLIQMEIAADGDAAEARHLPQFASIKARTLAKYSQQATPAATTTPTQDDKQKAQVTRAAQIEISALIAQNKSDAENGHPANGENFARIEELKRYL